MRTYYIIVVGALVIVFALLFFPTLHLVVGSVDISGFLPLTGAATVLLPYAFLGIAIYAIVKMAGK